MINNVNFNIGDILVGENNLPIDGNHYIVFYEALDQLDFAGAMISTKAFFGKNIAMSAAHFETHNNEDQTIWRVYYYNSHLVPAKLHKFNDMGPFQKVGQLTNDGVEFLIQNIGDKILMP